jgi:hypothetical protein
MSEPDSTDQRYLVQIDPPRQVVTDAVHSVRGLLEWAARRGWVTAELPAAVSETIHAEMRLHLDDNNAMAWHDDDEVGLALNLANV